MEIQGKDYSRRFNQNLAFDFKGLKLYKVKKNPLGFSTLRD